jgi:hypothetical protein
MMKYQLSTGKTILISFDDWLNMTDEKEQEYLSKDAGFFVEDPFKDPNYKEFEPKKYNIPEVDDYIEPLDENFIEEIKKEIDGDDG